MKTISIQDLKPISLNGIESVLITSNKNKYQSLCYNPNPNNCKLFTLDRIQGWLEQPYLEELHKVIKASNKLIFNVSLTNEMSLDRLKEHYLLVSVSKIPIGYGQGFQYHCCFLTKNTSYSDYDRYKKRIEESLKTTMFKEPLLQQTFEENSLDDLLKSLNKISPELLLKIKSYKQPKRAKDLLKSLL